MLQQVEVVEPHGSILYDIAVPTGNADGFGVFETFDVMVTTANLVNE